MNFEEWKVRFSHGKQNQGIFVVIWNISFNSRDRSAYCRTELLNGCGRVKYCIREVIESNLSQQIIAAVQNDLFMSVHSGNIKITKQR